MRYLTTLILFFLTFFETAQAGPPVTGTTPIPRTHVDYNNPTINPHDVIGEYLRTKEVRDLVAQATREGLVVVVYTDDGILHEDIVRLCLGPIGNVEICGQYGIPPELYYNGSREQWVENHKRAYNPYIDAVKVVTPHELEVLEQLSTCHSQRVWPWPLTNCWTYTESLWREWERTQ